MQKLQALIPICFRSKAPKPYGSGAFCLSGSKPKVGGDPENRVLPTFSFRTKIALLYALILCLKMCLSCAGELDIWCIAAEKASPPIMPPKGLLLPDLCPSKNAPVSWKVSWEFGYAGRFFVNFYWNCCTVPFNSVNLLLHFVCLFRQKRAEIPYNSSRKYNAKKLLHLSMQELFWSCYPDSNWGPHPYQGCALPAEL